MDLQVPKALTEQLTFSNAFIDFNASDDVRRRVIEGLSATFMKNEVLSFTQYVF